KAKQNRRTSQPHGEFVYRRALERGRHVSGYGVQKVLAAGDYSPREKGHPPVGVWGHGEGGLVALCSAAIDERVRAVTVAGYFSRREGVWKEPIYRNVWGFLREFGDAELGLLVAPRALRLMPPVERDRLGREEAAGPWPEVAGPPAPRDSRRGAAPGVLTRPPRKDVEAEWDRREKALSKLELPARDRRLAG